MAWSDKAREASAQQRRISAAADKSGMSRDAYSQRHGYKDHAEHLNMNAPRTGAAKNAYRPKPTGEW